MANMLQGALHFGHQTQIDYQGADVFLRALITAAEATPPDQRAQFAPAANNLIASMRQLNDQNKTHCATSRAALDNLQARISRLETDTSQMDETLDSLQAMFPERRNQNTCTKVINFIGRAAFWIASSYVTVAFIDAIALAAQK